MCLYLVANLGGAYAFDIDRTDHLVSAEVFFDGSSTMDINALESAVFRAFNRRPLRGYTAGATWFRLVVRPAPEGQTLFLRIRPNNRNHFTLFTPDDREPGGWRTSRTGNLVDWQDRPSFSLGLGFPIQPLGITTYYLRLETLANRSVDIDVLTQAEAARQQIASNLSHFTYLFLILLVVVWGLYASSNMRDRLLLLFALSHSMYFVLAIMSWGYVDALVPDSTIGTDFFYWVVLLTTTVAFSFHFRMISIFGLSRAVRLALTSVIALNAVAIGLMWMGSLTLALSVNNLAILLLAPLLFVASLLQRESQGIPRKSIRLIYYGLLLLSVFFHLTPVFGIEIFPLWIDHRTGPGYSSQLLQGYLNFGMVSALLFGHFLHARGRFLLAQSQAIAIALNVAEAEVVWQKDLLKKQEAFTAMLTHELKNPLASIRLTVDALGSGDQRDISSRLSRINNALKDIDALVEHCVLVDSIEQGLVQLYLVDLDPKQFVLDTLAKFPLAQQASIIIPQNLPTITTDERLLDFALSNLLENAFKYTVNHTSVQLSVSADPDSEGVIFEVSNLLFPGSQPDLNKIFDKYFRGAHTNGRRGTGLGLFLVRWIASRMGGSVAAHLVQQDRILFRLCLPLTPPQS